MSESLSNQQSPNFGLPNLDPVKPYLMHSSSTEPGTQSAVDLITLPDFPAGTEAVLLKRMAAGRGLSHHEARTLRDALGPYQESLRAAGWNIPQLYASHIVQVENEWQIWAYEEYIRGANLAAILRHGSNGLARYAISRVLATISSYEPTRHISHADQTLTLLPHGVDLQPTNIVMASTGAFYMIDTFGPKSTTENGELTSYNPQLDSASPRALTIVCATREGALLRFFRKTEALWPTPEDFVDEAEEALAFADIPTDEAQLVIADMAAGYELLDEAYRAS